VDLWAGKLGVVRSPASIFSTAWIHTQTQNFYERELITVPHGEKERCDIQYWKFQLVQTIFCRVAHDSGGDVMKTVMTFMT
jgi:hypothetical protein